MTSAGRWSGPRRIAHRGGGTLAPENTLAAIRAGLLHGYRAVEFDVMLTADDVPILMHDPLLGRTVAGSGPVAALTWAEIAALDAGAWWSVQFAGERVPRYDDVVRFCLANDVWMNVEIKPTPGRAVRTGEIVATTTMRLIDEAGADDPLARFLFSSFDVDALATAQRVAPHVSRGLLVEEVVPDTTVVAGTLGCVSVNADEATLDEGDVERSHAAGFAVFAYTVTDAVRAAALTTMGVDALFVDAIDRVPFA